MAICPGRRPLAWYTELYDAPSPLVLATRCQLRPAARRLRCTDSAGLARPVAGAPHLVLGDMNIANLMAGDYDLIIEVYGGPKARLLTSQTTAPPASSRRVRARRGHCVSMKSILCHKPYPWYYRPLEWLLLGLAHLPLSVLYVVADGFYLLWLYVAALSPAGGAGKPAQLISGEN